jgi:hypothetical protein
MAEILDQNKALLDSGESIFFSRQLETIRARSYDVLYPENKLFNKLPKGSDGDELSVDITHRSFDKVGIAKMGGGDYATDFPAVDIFGTETTVHVKNVQDSYHYAMDEIKRAAKVGIALDSRRALTARQAIDYQLESVSKNGDAVTGLKGFYNQSGITEYSVPDGSTAYTGVYYTDWTHKTADEILADMNGTIFAIQQGTAGVENPDNIALPMARYNLIKTKRISTGDSFGKTVLQYFQEQNVGVTVDWYAGLDTAAATNASYDGNMMMIAWKNSLDKLVFDLPMGFSQLDTLRDGLAFVVPCRAKTAGVTVFYPKSVAYAKGI